MQRVSEAVRQAGSDMASQLYDASVQKALGGCMALDFSKYPVENHDLIMAYLNGEMLTVEAIYLCMNRVANEQ